MSTVETLEMLPFFAAVSMLASGEIWMQPKRVVAVAWPCLLPMLLLVAVTGVMMVHELNITDATAARESAFTVAF